MQLQDITQSQILLQHIVPQGLVHVTANNHKPDWTEPEKNWIISYGFPLSQFQKLQKTGQIRPVITIL